MSKLDLVGGFHEIVSEEAERFARLHAKEVLLEMIATGETIPEFTTLELPTKSGTTKTIQIRSTDLLG